MIGAWLPVAGAPALLLAWSWSLPAPLWDPPAEHLVFVSSAYSDAPSPALTHDLFLLDNAFVGRAPAAAVTRLTPPGTEGDGRYPPAVSPDGRAALYAVDESGALAVVALPSGEPLYPDLELRGFHPDWLPDGERIVFHEADWDGPQPIHVLDLATGEDHPLRFGGAAVACYDPAFAPDGRQMACVADGGLVLYGDIDCPASGPCRARRRDALGGGSWEHPSVDPAWSGDGRWIAFMRHEGSDPYDPELGYDPQADPPAVLDGQIPWNAFVVDTRTGAERRATGFTAADRLSVVTPTFVDDAAVGVAGAPPALVFLLVSLELDEGDGAPPYEDVAFCPVAEPVRLPYPWDPGDEPVPLVEDERVWAAHGAAERYQCAALGWGDDHRAHLRFFDW